MPGCAAVCTDDRVPHNDPKGACHSTFDIQPCYMQHAAVHAQRFTITWCATILTHGSLDSGPMQRQAACTAAQYATGLKPPTIGCSAACSASNCAASRSASAAGSRRRASAAGGAGGHVSGRVRHAITYPDVPRATVETSASTTQILPAPAYASQAAASSPASRRPPR